MKAIVLGLGVQGHKRRRVAGDDYVACVDPVNEEADYKRIQDVPLDSYDAALACIPDDPKIETLTYLLSHGKHVLVEKPLWAGTNSELEALQTLARENNAVCYTAYNHRFEPHYVAMRDLIQSGELGKVYRCRMFYGNGTARLVRNSAWRDQGAGVWPDLGSHLLDTLSYWFGPQAIEGMDLISANTFENTAPDHVVVGSESGGVKTELEMTLLMWRNHFTCDVLAENGTAHISSLCKWGPSSFTKRLRVLPSGRPPEQTVTLVQDDPTWEAEYAHFKSMVTNGERADLSNDMRLNEIVQRIGAKAVSAAGS